MTVREALEALPLPEYLEAADPVDSELAYVLAVLRMCVDHAGLVDQLPSMLHTVAGEIARLRQEQAGPVAPSEASARLRRLWSGEPGLN